MDYYPNSKNRVKKKKKIKGLKVKIYSIDKKLFISSLKKNKISSGLYETF